jgi:hypothetical protein
MTLSAAKPPPLQNTHEGLKRILSDISVFEEATIQGLVGSKPHRSGTRGANSMLRGDYTKS